MGIEPTHKGFADLSLTTWVPRLNLSSIAKSFGLCQAGSSRQFLNLSAFPKYVPSAIRPPDASRRKRTR